MPSLSNHHSSTLVKMLYAGNSSTGKTGSLASLVKAGYKIGMLDLDNGIDILKAYCDRDGIDTSNIFYVPVRDDYAVNQMNQFKVKGQPKAFVKVANMTTKWDDPDTPLHGTSPCDWGPEWIFVLDSLSTLGRAAHAWAESINPGAKEPRTWFFAAQQAIENYITMLTSASFKTNVIVITHITYDDDEGSGMKKGFPSAIGKALGPQLPKYFNNLVLAESEGQNKNVKRTIRTVPTGVVDLKTSAPFKVDAALPLETGMATLFEQLKGK